MKGGLTVAFSITTKASRRCPGAQGIAYTEKVYSSPSHSHNHIPTGPLAEAAGSGSSKDGRRASSSHTALPYGRIPGAGERGRGGLHLPAPGRNREQRVHCCCCIPALFPPCFLRCSTLGSGLLFLGNQLVRHFHNQLVDCMDIGIATQLRIDDVHFLEIVPVVIVYVSTFN